MGIQDVKDVALIRHAYVRSADQGRGIGGRLLEGLRDQTGVDSISVNHLNYFKMLNIQ